MNEQQTERNYKHITCATASMKRVTPAHTDSKAPIYLNRQCFNPSRVVSSKNHVCFFKHNEEPLPLNISSNCLLPIQNVRTECSLPNYLICFS